MPQTSYYNSNQNWTPNSESDCIFWLNAITTGNNKGYTDGSSVTSAIDQSPSNLTISTTSAPTFKANILNGNPGILFDGTANFLKVASLACSTNFTVMVVAKPTGGKYFFMEQSLTANSNPGFFLYGSSNNSMTVHRSSTGSGTNVTNSGGTNLTNWFNALGYAIWQNNQSISLVGTTNLSFQGTGGLGSRTHMNIRFKGVNQYVYSPTQATLTVSTITDDMYIMSRAGTGVFQSGYVFDIAIFNSAKGTNFITNAENYIHQTWGPI